MHNEIHYAMLKQKYVYMKNKLDVDSIHAIKQVNCEAKMNAKSNLKRRCVNRGGSRILFRGGANDYVPARILRVRNRTHYRQGSRARLRALWLF